MIIKELPDSFIKTDRFIPVDIENDVKSQLKELLELNIDKKINTVTKGIIRLISEQVNKDIENNKYSNILDIVYMLECYLYDRKVFNSYMSNDFLFESVYLILENDLNRFNIYDDYDDYDDTNNYYEYDDYDDY